MFERPSKTLQHSLFHVLENAQEYVADVCFQYPNQPDLWAHKALLLARVPELFRNKYMSVLDKSDDPTIYLDISVVIPYTTLRQLLRFWYIADFSAPLDEASLLSSHIAGLSLTEASSALQSEVEASIRHEIALLENKLAMPVLPISTTMSDTEQWTADLKRMMDEKIATDVVVNIFNATKKEDLPLNHASFPAHRFILASQSPYFYAVFCTEFREASTSSVHMPSDLFSSTTLQVILHYFYTDALILPSFVPVSKHVSKLNEKKHELRILQKVFAAADFLGHQETICKAVLVKMSILCHHFKCVCSDCAILLPSMLLFADKNEKYLPKLRSKLIALYADPLDSLAPLWSQKPFAILVNSMASVTPVTTTSTVTDGAQVISQIFNSKVTIPSPISPTPTLDSNQSLTSSVTLPESNLITEITERTFANITKHNSVRVLHSLHLCLSYLRGADPFPTWSQPTLNILNQFLHSTVDMISSNFDYYCVEYPILLSCVDGIGFGFSVDFLGFVLKRVLTEGIHDGNAAILYQGIVRDLGGRQEMVRNVAVDSVLLDGRVKSAQYIAKRWMSVKAAGGFVTIEKDILRLLAEDINVPIRNLTKPLENDFSSAIFSFKPKKVPNTSVARAVSKEHETVTPVALKRLSVGPEEPKSYPKIVGRTRSLSASTSSHDSILKKESKSHHSDSEERVSIPRRKSNTMPAYRTYKRNGSTGSLTDALLPIEAPKDTDKKETNEKDLPRPTRLRFALPDTPSRASKHGPRLSAIQNNTSSNVNNNSMNMAQKASARKKKRAKSPGKSRWSLGYSTSDSSDDEGNPKKKNHAPMIGQKIELLRRPLPTQGTIKYIGDVDFAKGVWVGVELESRLGNNDGSVDGKRYFQTFPQRGVFVKIDDFKILSNDKK
ncbi:uncharacterized protein EV154DRAFT_496653 [Mucor mucedo]|uniref:uncharacterized protein n=1 Tax=Mucor mucedo TaxID=29922 RepID=UPI00221EC6BF|nr:uncharacterized protein EV154DRAFT_496653 [Mucor mucedo]KAI7894992.1 hypothetical protein EV154DRAFT_496653 [Mucor mucedo]